MSRKHVLWCMGLYEYFHPSLVGGRGRVAQHAATTKEDAQMDTSLSDRIANNGFALQTAVEDGDADEARVLVGKLETDIAEMKASLDEEPEAGDVGDEDDYTAPAADPQSER